MHDLNDLIAGHGRRRWRLGPSGWQLQRGRRGCVGPSALSLLTASFPAGPQRQRSVMGFFFFTTQLMQDVFGFTVFQAGLGSLLMTAVNFPVATMLPRVVRRFDDAVPLVAGVVLTLLGMGWLANVDASSVELAHGSRVPRVSNLSPRLACGRAPVTAVTGRCGTSAQCPTANRTSGWRRAWSRDGTVRSVA